MNKPICRTCSRGSSPKQRRTTGSSTFKPATSSAFRILYFIVAKLVNEKRRGERPGNADPTRLRRPLYAAATLNVLVRLSGSAKAIFSQVIRKSLCFVFVTNLVRIEVADRIVTVVRDPIDEVRRCRLVSVGVLRRHLAWLEVAFANQQVRCAWR